MSKNASLQTLVLLLLLAIAVSIAYEAGVHSGARAEAADRGDEPHYVQNATVTYRLYWGDENKGEGGAIEAREILVRNNTIIVRTDDGGVVLPLNESLRSFSWIKK